MSSSSAQPPEPPWLARPSGACCLKGHIHTGTPRGTFEHIAGIETYVSRPPAGVEANGHAILYYPDVYGFFTNGLLIMDEMAERGYLVLGIDYFKGDPVWLYRDGPKSPKPDFDFDKWLAKYVKVADEVVPGWVEGVKGKFGKPGMKYACVGYCFGAPYVCNSLTKTPSGGEPYCDVGAFAHPAFLKDHHFQNLERPLFLSCAETDHTFPTEARNKAVDILREAKKPYGLQLFSGVEHGFALRCDLSVPYARYCKEASLKAIVEYFDTQLGVKEKRDGDAKL